MKVEFQCWGDFRFPADFRFLAVYRFPVVLTGACRCSVAYRYLDACRYLVACRYSGEFPVAGPAVEMAFVQAAVNCPDDGPNWGVIQLTDGAVDGKNLETASGGRNVGHRLD